LSSRIRTDLPLGKPLASNCVLRKDERPAPLKSHGLRLNSNRMDACVQPRAHAALHEPNSSNPCKPAVPPTTMLSIPHKCNDIKNSQTIQDWPLGKPIAYVKQISSIPAVPKVDHPTPLKSLVLGSIHTDIPGKPSAPAMQLAHSDPSKSAIPLAMLTYPQSNGMKMNLLSSALPCTVNDTSKTQHAIVDDNIEMHSSKIPKFFIHASTQCVFEPEIPHAHSYQTVDYQLPSNYSQLPRTGQYLLSEWVYSAHINFRTFDVIILSQG
jgi:hypothetical protein